MRRIGLVLLSISCSYAYIKGPSSLQASYASLKARFPAICGRVPRSAARLRLTSKKDGQGDNSPLDMFGSGGFDQGLVPTDFLQLHEMILGATAIQESPPLQQDGDGQEELLGPSDGPNGSCETRYVRSSPSKIKKACRLVCDRAYESIRSPRCESMATRFFWPMLSFMALLNTQHKNAAVFPLFLGLSSMREECP